MKKITKATFKSFVKKNTDKLFIQLCSDFDGMSDCVEFIPSNQRKFVEMKKDTVSDSDYRYGLEQGKTREQIETSFFNNKYTLGYRGIWLVNHSRDSFQAYDDEQFTGIHVYNCCGSFTVAIKK